MRELIDRAALIAEYDRVHVGSPGCARKLMEDAPVIEERKTGQWVDGEVSYDDTVMQVIVCDQCLAFFPLQFGDSHNYCPNCGADMRGEKDENN